MTTGFKIYNRFGAYFLTFTIVDWIDLFSRKIYKDIFMESLDYCSKHKGLKVYAYVIMTNHVHLIVQSGGDIQLSHIVRDLKKFSSRKFIEAIKSEPESRREWLLHKFRFNADRHSTNSKHQIWQYDSHAMEILSNDFFNQKQNYIHQNPVRAGIVSLPEDYIYSSAFELANRGSKVELAIWR